MSNRVAVECYTILNYTWLFKKISTLNPFTYAVSEDYSGGTSEQHSTFKEHETAPLSNTLDQSMNKTMHQVVIFMEEQEDDWSTPLKIGNLFFNRFGIDEDAAFESVGVYNLQKSSHKINGSKKLKNRLKRIKKGMDINHIYLRNHFIKQIIGYLTNFWPIF